MAHRGEDKAAFKRQFAVRRKRQLILAALLLVPFAMIVIGFERLAYSGHILIVMPAFFVFAVGASIFSLWSWRCPACKRYLGQHTNPRFCSKCGEPLR